jgi:hypothetical protein
MNEGTEGNDEIETDDFDDVWLSGAIVVRGALPAIRQLFADVRKRPGLKVVYVRASGARLRILTEDPP